MKFQDNTPSKPLIWKGCVWRSPVNGRHCQLSDSSGRSQTTIRGRCLCMGASSLLQYDAWEVIERVISVERAAELLREVDAQLGGLTRDECRGLKESLLT